MIYGKKCDAQASQTETFTYLEQKSRSLTRACFTTAVRSKWLFEALGSVPLHSALCSCIHWLPADVSGDSTKQ